MSILILFLACAAPQQAGLSPQPGAISGRICSSDGAGWQADAEVDVHVLEGNEIVDTRTAWTDPAGSWLVEDLPGDAEYDVFVQYRDERLLDQEAYGVWVGSGELVVLDEPACAADPASYEVAIVTGDFDDLPGFAQDLGLVNLELVDGSDPATVAAFLASSESLDHYDLVMVAGGFQEEGVVYVASAEQEEAVDQALRGVAAYVDAGGALLVTAQAYDLLEAIWPDRLVFQEHVEGVPDSGQVALEQDVRAAVSDAVLASWLDVDYLDLHYSPPAAPVVASASASVSVHLSGKVTAETAEGPLEISSSPLLVSFSDGGEVVYSSVAMEPNRDSGLDGVLTYLLATF